MSADTDKYDPALGVYDERSLRAAGRYWEALQYEINGREDWIGDEYFRCERMLIAVERAMSAHDHEIDADDNYHKRTDTAAAEIVRLRGEVEILRGQIHDEIAANLAFREAGGALPGEDMPTFCARLLAERDATIAPAEAKGCNCGGCEVCDATDLLPQPAGGEAVAWISVTDRLPTEADYGEHERVLVRYRYTDVPGRGWTIGDSYHDADSNRWNAGWQFGSCDYAEVSHWMRFDDLLALAGTTPPAAQVQPVCPATGCGAQVLFECPACSHHNYPPREAAQVQQEAVAQTLRDALGYAGYRTDGDLATLAERADLWMRESRVLIDSQRANNDRLKALAHPAAGGKVRERLEGLARRWDESANRDKDDSRRSAKRKCAADLRALAAALAQPQDADRG